MKVTEQFPGQRPEEKVILVLHRHWFVLIKDLVVVLLLMLVPLIIFLVARRALDLELAPDSFGYAALVMGGGLYYLFVWNLAFGYWLDYLLDYCVVTDLRVVDIEQSGLFNRTIAEQLLHRVQDVTTEVKGFFPTMFKYGHVYIQTASENQRFEFAAVPNPEEVAKTILRLSEAKQKKAPVPAETTYTVKTEKPTPTIFPPDQQTGTTISK